MIKCLMRCQHSKILAQREREREKVKFAIINQRSGSRQTGLMIFRRVGRIFRMFLADSLASNTQNLK